MIIYRIRCCWYFLWGQVFSLLFYDKKYLSGRWFSGRFHGICADGWKWLVKDALFRILFKCNTEAKFPVAYGCRVVHPENIDFHPDDLNNFQSFGSYFQAIGKITIGKGTYIASNVGLITANHNVDDLEAHLPAKDIIIGKKCWIGMNSVILPGTVLGDHTIVGAGSVVTKSFLEGNCVIAGNPAKIIRYLKA